MFSGRMVRRSSAVPHTLPVCPWWTLGGSALVAAVTVTLAGGPARGGRVSAQEPAPSQSAAPARGSSFGGPSMAPEPAAEGPAADGPNAEGVAGDGYASEGPLDGAAVPFFPVGGPYAGASLVPLSARE